MSSVRPGVGVLRRREALAGLAFVLPCMLLFLAFRGVRFFRSVFFAAYLIGQRYVTEGVLSSGIKG